MAERSDFQWDTCGVDGCIGVRPNGMKGCLAHDERHWDVALERLRKDGHVDARGVKIDTALLEQILSAAPSKAERPVFRDALFDYATFTATAKFLATFKGRTSFFGATFEGGAGFTLATFEDEAWFREANFKEGAEFGGARFKGAAWFLKATFQGETEFRAATFDQSARFDQATFEGAAGFRDVTFHWVVFSQATFKDRAGFLEVGFKGDADFEQVTFEDTSSFGYAAFRGEATFNQAMFRGAVWFYAARFAHKAEFHQVIFGGEAEFGSASFGGQAEFHQAAFEEARQFGRALGATSLELDGATFRQRIQIEVDVPILSCRNSRFLAGVQFRLRWARVVLDDADLAAPSILAGAPLSAGRDEPQLLAWSKRSGGPPRQLGRPWVASVCRADVAGLAIANADLQACQFAGARNLDRLWLETTDAFAVTPGLRAVQTGWAWPPMWWWTRRRTLAEEHAWRAANERGIRRSGWHAGESWDDTADHWVPNPPHPAPDFGRVERHIGRTVRDWRHLNRRLALTRRIWDVRRRQERVRGRQAISARQQRAREIANLYRALRKGREDAKDEPGAADFYYGEMEMRRYAAPRFSVEHLVLTLYWLVAGYALRAWRALTALVAVLVVMAWLFVQHDGFVDPRGITFWGALRYSARTAIGLLPKDQPALTPWGDMLQIAVRIIVPVLLGLAVLSVRGRVKR
jgi:uncharacterized protein YjbI with pentapeptide repeats